MKVFILIIIMLFTNPAPGNSIASKSRVLGDGRLADTCQEVTAALVSFKFFATFLGSRPGRRASVENDV
jgi:hypothetical protein